MEFINIYTLISGVVTILIANYVWDKLKVKKKHKKRVFEIKLIINSYKK